MHRISHYHKKAPKGILRVSFFDFINYLMANKEKTDPVRGFNFTLSKDLVCPSQFTCVFTLEKNEKQSQKSNPKVIM